VDKRLQRRRRTDSYGKGTTGEGDVHRQLRCVELKSYGAPYREVFVIETFVS
jgi:hypothetical protein